MPQAVILLFLDNHADSLSLWHISIKKGHKRIINITVLAIVSETQLISIVGLLKQKKMPNFD